MRLRRLLVVSVLAVVSIGTSAGGARAAPGAICTTPPTSDTNVNTDCETHYHFEFGDVDLPAEETTIAVDPTDPSNMIGSAKDKQFKLTKKGKPAETELARAHVTSDGGQTWTTYAIGFPGYRFTTDPSIAFDDAGTAYLGVLALPTSGDPSIVSDFLVVRSEDGGKTWSKPVVASERPGEFRGASQLNDNSRLAAWGNGNVVVVWLAYAHDRSGRTIRGPVVDAVSHDGGATWSSPAKISSSADFCVGFKGGDACNQNVNDAVAVSPAGNVVVVFTNTTQFGAEGYQTRTKRMAVQVDPDTGTRIGGPFVIGRSFEGIGTHDYPVSQAGFAKGSPTIHDSQILIGGQGNVAADPKDPQHFAAVWYDDRNAPHPVAINPYDAVTNTDVIVSQSFDGGSTWSTPAAIEYPGDQFMAWGAYDGQGRLRIGYYDRSYDPDNHEFGYTLATETQPGSLKFTNLQVTTELSNPTRRSEPFYRARTRDPDFPHPSSFIGDYTPVAATPTGVVAYWTDLRRHACILDECGHGQDAYFASVP